MPSITVESSAVESSRQAGPPVEKGGPADGHRSGSLPAGQVARSGRGGGRAAAAAAGPAARFDACRGIVY